MNRKKYGRSGSLKNEKDKIQKYMDELLSVEVSGNVDAEDLSIISELKSFYNEKSIDENSKDYEETPTNKEDVESYEYFEAYTEAARLDRENYVSFFGTDEEKEKLRLEKEALENEQKRKADEQRLKAEKEEKARLLAEELEIKNRAEQLVKEKEILQEKVLGESVQIDYYIKELMKKLTIERDRSLTITKNSPNIWTEEERIEVEKLNSYYLEVTELISRIKRPQDVYDLEALEKYKQKCIEIKNSLNDYIENNLGFLYRISLLETSKYPLKIASQLYKTSTDILKFMFDYVENDLIFDKNLNIELVSDACYFKNKKIVYRITIKRNSDYKLKIIIECRQQEKTSDKDVSTYIQFNLEDYNTKLIPANIEDLFFQVLSRQWHEFKNEEGKIVKGIKEKFLDKTNSYRVKENIDEFTI